MMVRRGLTLVEILAATALLALLAATTLPLLSSSLEAIPRPDDRSLDQVDLRRLSDKLLADPAAFGLESLETVSETTLNWPEHPDRPSVTLRRLTSSEEEPAGHWLQLECQGLRVHQWLKAQAPEPAET